MTRTRQIRSPQPVTRSSHPRNFQHPRNPRNPRNSRNRGSVLILVVTILVLMLLIGMAYIQTAKTDRLSTAGVSRNIDQVVNAEIGRVLQTLKDDIVNSSNGNMLDNANTSAREPYDYPYTNSTASKYGQLDDAWLASSSVNSSNVWAHITNIGNGFRVNSSGNLTAGNDTDIDATASSTSWPYADADNDGITDSKFTDSAIAQINGVRYVTAMRIIDLSALVNINVALADVKDSGSMDSLGSGYEPRWWYPTTLDFAGWVYRNNNSDFDSNEILDLLNYRFGITTGSLPMSKDSRNGFWEYGVVKGYPGTGSPAYTSIQSPGNEALLRYRNGLNSPKTSDQLNSSTMLQKLMRDDQGEENDYTAAGYGSTPYAYLSQEPRHQMTVSSGSIPFRLPLITSGLTDPDTVTDPGNLKVDINKLTAEELKAEILTVLEAMTSTFKPPLARTDITSKEQFAAQFAASIKNYAASSNDEDTPPDPTKPGDNKLVGVTSSDNDVTYYGISPLPFITEAYRQRAYMGKWIQTNSQSGSEEWTLKWQHEGDTGYAIEFRNPFTAKIDLQNVYIRFAGTSTPIKLSDFCGQDTLDIGESVTVYHKSGDDTTHAAANNHDDFSGIIDGDKQEYGTAVPELDDSTAVTVELLADTDGGPIGQVVYQRLKLKEFDNSVAEVAVPDVDPEQQSEKPSAVTPGATGYLGYIQADNFGNGNGINMLTVTANEFQGAYVFNDATGKVIDVSGGSDTYNSTDFDALGIADKTGKGDTKIANRVDPTKNQIIFNPPDTGGKIRLIGDLAMIAALGPKYDATSTETTPIADVWGTYSDTDLADGFDSGDTQIGAAGFMLNFFDSSLVNTGNYKNILALPYAAVLIDRFTTMGYGADGIDNNGDGTIDERAEAFIPGQININTVSEKTLENLLPIPDPTYREAIAKVIVAYRDCKDTGEPNYDFSDDKRGTGITGYRTLNNSTKAPGIASIGELFVATQRIFGHDSNDNKNLNSTTVDFTPNDGTADNVTDDREEQAMVLRWLSQVCTTRSDTFAAYIYIRGYDSSDSGSDVFDSSNLAEVARVLVIFDRSNIVDSTDSPKVIGYVRYK